MYAHMGGFVIDIRHGCAERMGVLLPQDLRRVTLTTNALLYIAAYEPDLLPDISKSVIEDNSKTDGVAKWIALVQATWFCLQCTMRLVQGLPITLLELNVLAHILYAFFIYVFWWNKPLDIHEPTEIILHDEQSVSMFALMFLNSTIGFMHPCNDSPCFGRLAFSQQSLGSLDDDVDTIAERRNQRPEDIERKERVVSE
ncbi:hypothetical protein ACHAQH_003049 [Verticillium albo-atrum]